MNGLNRDTVTNRIISYIDERSVENKGQIEIPVVDERFLANDFNFIVKTKFSSLQDAVDAEKQVFTQLDIIQKSILKGIPLGSLQSIDIENVQNIAKSQLLENLSNIAENNPESIPGLQKRIDELQQLVDDQREQLEGWQVASEGWQETVSLWANERLKETIRADAFERLSLDLSEQQEQILTGLKVDIDVQNLQNSGSVSALAQRTDKNLKALNEEIKAIRNINNNLGDLSSIVLSDFLASSGTGGTGGTGGI